MQGDGFFFIVTYCNFYHIHHHISSCANLLAFGNPHAHIMLTVRPLKENGAWGAKCRKAYDLDENGQRIPDGKGGWKNHREDTTDWNDQGKAELWREA